MAKSTYTDFNGGWRKDGRSVLNRNRDGFKLAAQELLKTNPEHASELNLTPERLLEVENFREYSVNERKVDQGAFSPKQSRKPGLYFNAQNESCYYGGPVTNEPLETPAHICLRDEAEAELDNELDLMEDDVRIAMRQEQLRGLIIDNFHNVRPSSCQLIGDDLDVDAADNPINSWKDVNDLPAAIDLDMPLGHVPAQKRVRMVTSRTYHPA